jgi:hypothetical protein
MPASADLEVERAVDPMVVMVMVNVCVSISVDPIGGRSEQALLGVVVYIQAGLTKREGGRDRGRERACVCVCVCVCV